MCCSSSYLHALPWDTLNSATKSLTARFMGFRTLSSSPAFYQAPTASSIHLRPYSSSIKEDSLEANVIKARTNCVPTITNENPVLGRIAGDIVGAGDVLLTHEKMSRMDLLMTDRGYLDRFGSSIASWSIHRTKGTFSRLSPKSLEDTHNIDAIVDSVWKALYDPRSLHI